MHILQEDILLWEEFLKSRHNAFDFYEYDVRVGKGRPAEPGTPSNIAQMATDLSQRRIDVVAHIAGTQTCIEITVKADMKCLGQTIAYPKLYLETFPKSKTRGSWVVTRQIGTDLAQVFSSTGTFVIVLPRDPAPEDTTYTTAQGVHITKLLPEEVEDGDF